MSDDSSAGAGEDVSSRPKSSKGKQKPLEGAPRDREQLDETQSRPGRAAEEAQSPFSASPGLSLLSFSGPVETVSNLPGRIRFRVNAIVGSESAKGTLVENLQKIKGVNSVEVNLISGSVLVLYQPQVIAPEILFAAIIKLLDLESEFLRTPEPVLATELREVATSLNRTVYELTGGIADLHTALLISLALFGVYMFRKDPVRAFPGGFTLLWWAYSSFRNPGGPN